jgi:hypothetical protein
LNTFYKKHRADVPTDDLTEITNFRHKTLGKLSERKLRTKAAATWGFLLFLIEACGHKFSVLAEDGATLLEAGQSLIRMVRTWENAGACMLASEIQVLFEAWTKFLSLTQAYEDLHTPKRHIMTHLLEQVGFLGNPRVYANWQDESLNRLLKSACRNLSQQTFETCVLPRMAVLLKATSKPYWKGLKRRRVD